MGQNDLSVTSYVQESTASDAKKESDSNGQLRMFHAAAANATWPKVFGSSHFMSATALLILRATLAVLFTVVLVVTMIQFWDQGYYFIYLTHWSFILETCYLWCVTLVTVRAMFWIQEVGEGCTPGPERLPWYVSLVWLLWSIAMPTCILVTVVFWTALDPFWKATDVSWHTLCEHLVNTLLLIVELLASRNVFFLKHVGALYAYGFAYIFWSLIDFWAKIGNGHACPNLHYGPHECPIYSILDWHKAPKTSIWLVAVLVIAGLSALAVWALVHLRDACSSRLQYQLSKQKKQASAAEEHEEYTMQHA